MTFSTIAVLATNDSFIAERRGANVQFNAQILAERLCKAKGHPTPQSGTVQAGARRCPYSHFFHLKYMSGPTAANSIANTASG
jgi:hypothetical protein